MSETKSKIFATLKYSSAAEPYTFFVLFIRLLMSVL